VVEGSVLLWHVLASVVMRRAFCIVLHLWFGLDIVFGWEALEFFAHGELLLLLRTVINTGDCVRYYFRVREGNAMFGYANSP
jgi:hypothetical protein